MEKLPKIQNNFKGVGIPGLTAEQVKRTKTQAMYKRADGVYEVFRITIKEAGEIFGKSYPRHEHYPNNENFGKIAWSFSNYEKAEECYNNIGKFDLT